MNRTTIMLPDDLHRQATDLAARQGISLGEFIRRAVAQEASATQNAHAVDGFWMAPPVFHSGQSDLAEHHDEALYGPRR